MPIEAGKRGNTGIPRESRSEQRGFSMTGTATKESVHQGTRITPSGAWRGEKGGTPVKGFVGSPPGGHTTRDWGPPDKSDAPTGGNR